eukprot:TRINITY_DN2868_c1_g1_i1.p1 TRINITY_DN2868_c1_g1~~TRINITY_DN2868_c1_g1_i1.p1  ORF type:complete len:1250 (+),score=232.55 TRINITY_DN2868_c1_g1_i1:511-3750(+)
MYHVLDTATTAIRRQTMVTIDNALEVQKARESKLVFENVTATNLNGVLRSTGASIHEFLRKPADRAVQFLEGSLHTHRLLNESWDGNIEDYRRVIQHRIWMELTSQWDLEDGEWGTSSTPVPADSVSRRKQTEALSITQVSGRSTGMAVSTYNIQCPHAGPAVCGSCQGLCTHLDFYMFDSPAGTSGNTSKTYRRVDKATGIPVGKPMLVTDSLRWQRKPEFAVQQRMAAEALLSEGGSASVKNMGLWSEIHPYPNGYLKLSWTAPSAPCGTYECFDGVFSADVELGQISFDCSREWSKLRKMLEAKYSFRIEPETSSAFIVNHVSDNFPHQRGILLGSSESSSYPSEIRQAEMLPNTPNGKPDIVAATSKAILAKFKAWDAPELQTQEHVLSFRKSSALQGQHVSCAEWSSADAAGESLSADCFSAGTLSLEMDPRTRWLVVVVVPAGAFQAHALSTEHLVNSELTLISNATQDSVNEARIAAAVIFVSIGVLSVFIASMLAWAVSEPLQRLSTHMRALGEFDFHYSLHEDTGEAPQVKDIADFQKSFRRLLWGAHAFSRFVPETVVTRIVNGDLRATRLHVDKRNVTIMFSGIRDFSQTGALLGDEQMLRVITKFHTAMIRIVEQYEGTVAEILDDGLLVYWNAAEKVRDHPRKACEAGVAQQRAMISLAAKLVEEGLLSQKLSESCLQLCVGIHTGHVLCGNIGSTMKMKFGCMGDSMNLASRMQGLCKHYNLEVLCSDATHAQTSGLLCRKVDLVKVRGRREATTVYEVIGRDSNKTTTRSTPCSSDELNISQADCAGGPSIWGRRRHFLFDSSSSDPDDSTTRSIRSRHLPHRLPLWKPQSKFTKQAQQLSQQQVQGLEQQQQQQQQQPQTQTSQQPQQLPCQLAQTRPNLLPRLPLPNRSSPVAMPSCFGRSPAGHGSEGGRSYKGRSLEGWPSVGSLGSPLAVIVDEQVTEEQREHAALYEKAFGAYQEARFGDAIEMCNKLLEARPNDMATRKLLEKASNPGDDGPSVDFVLDWSESWTKALQDWMEGKSWDDYKVLDAQSNVIDPFTSPPSKDVFPLRCFRKAVTGMLEK